MRVYFWCDNKPTRHSLWWQGYQVCPRLQFLLICVNIYLSSASFERSSARFSNRTQSREHHRCHFNRHTMYTFFSKAVLWCEFDSDYLMKSLQWKGSLREILIRLLHFIGQFKRSVSAMADQALMYSLGISKPF